MAGLIEEAIGLKNVQEICFGVVADGELFTILHRQLRQQRDAPGLLNRIADSLSFAGKKG